MSNPFTCSMASTYYKCFDPSANLQEVSANCESIRRKKSDPDAVSKVYSQGNVTLDNGKTYQVYLRMEHGLEAKSLLERIAHKADPHRQQQKNGTGEFILKALSQSVRQSVNSEVAMKLLKDEINRGEIGLSVQELQSKTYEEITHSSFMNYAVHKHFGMCTLIKPDVSKGETEFRMSENIKAPKLESIIAFSREVDNYLKARQMHV